uniref:Glycosyltransferase 2-like domain-containing protein n=1 Tax=viral metagenome TaxID=1070528 RepID=A0A6C0EMF4_9ZZZZ
MKMELCIEEVTEKAPTICLNMIVKNESKIITRLLETVSPIIDTYCICDTGSTDMTIEIIKEFFDMRCIEGKIIEEPFKNFGHNRTVALNAAKEMADYLLFLDADMKLVIDPAFDKSKLTADVYTFAQGSNILNYFNVRLIKTSLNFRCIGSTHEYYDITGPKKEERLNTIKINDIGDGGCKEDKFTRDIRLLEEDLKENPKNERTYFYLANSYKNAGNLEKAIENYIKRIAIGGWIEENWYSRLELGKCYMSIGKEAEAIKTWLEAYGYHPKRAENLYEIVKHYRIKGQHQLSYIFYKLAKEIPYPSDNVLFIHKDVYNYLLDYEFSIIAYYIDRNIDMRPIFMKLMNIDALNMDNILANYKFYVKTLKKYEQKEVVLNLFAEISGEEKDSFKATTPSIIAYNDGYLTNVRIVDYTLHLNGSYSYPDGYSVNTKNIALVMDKDFNVTDSHVFVPEFNTECRIRGLEDVKIIDCGENIGYISTKQSDTTSDYILTMAGGIYDLSGESLEYSEITSPEKAKCEKNWALFMQDDHLRVIYKWHPLTIYDFAKMQLGTVTRKEMPPFFKKVRGSTNGAIYKDELWFIGHVVEHGEPRHYYHLFIVLDKNTLELRKYSYLFRFDKEEKVEFSLGLVVEDYRLIVSHSNWDRTSKLKIFDKEKILKELFV